MVLLILFKEQKLLKGPLSLIIRLLISPYILHPLCFFLYPICEFLLSYVLDSILESNSLD